MSVFFENYKGSLTPTCDVCFENNQHEPSAPCWIIAISFFVRWIIQIRFGFSYYSGIYANIVSFMQFGLSAVNQTIECRRELWVIYPLSVVHDTRNQNGWNVRGSTLKHANLPNEMLHIWIISSLWSFLPLQNFWLLSPAVGACQNCGIHFKGVLHFF